MKQFFRKFSDFTTDYIEGIMIFGIVASISLIILIVHHRESVTMPKAFSAWEKHTGNPQRLTYDEWRSLMSASEDSNQNTVIFMPIR